MTGENIVPQTTGKQYCSIGNITGTINIFVPYVILRACSLETTFGCMEVLMLLMINSYILMLDVSYFFKLLIGMTIGNPKAPNESTTPLQQSGFL